MSLKTKAEMQEKFEYIGNKKFLKEHSDNKLTLAQAVAAEITRLGTTEISVLQQHYHTGYEPAEPILATKRWDIAIILNNKETMSVDDGDDAGLIELINKLPQAIQAYFNITGEKLNAAVIKSRWRQYGMDTISIIKSYCCPAHIDSVNGYNEKIEAHNKNRKEISNIIGIQPTSTSQIWYTYTYTKANDVTRDIANIFCLDPSAAKLVELKSELLINETDKMSNVDTMREFCFTMADSLVDTFSTVYYIK